MSHSTLILELLTTDDPKDRFLTNTYFTKKLDIYMKVTYMSIKRTD